MTHPQNLYTLPGHLIRRLHQQSTAVFQDQTRAAGFDLTSVQYAALSVLESEAGLDQATLAKRIAYDRATIGGVVKRLEQKGLVTRAPDNHDRRAYRLDLTPEGKTLLIGIRPVVGALQARILPGLSPSEVDTLLRLIRRALPPIPDSEDPA